MVPAAPNTTTVTVDRTVAAIPIGVRIRSLLEELGKSPAWLADRVGVSRSTVTRILKGDRNPTAQTLQEMSPVLGVELEHLVAGTDAENRVEEARQFVSRRDYEGAIQQVIDFERQAHDLRRTVRDLEEQLAEERHRRERSQQNATDAERRCGDLQARCDQESRKAKHHEQDARRYRKALQKAVADVAELQGQVRELGEAVKSGKMTSRIGAILAGVAAVVSVANYLRPNGDDVDEEDTE